MTTQSAMFSLKTYDLPLTPGQNTIGTLNNAQRTSMTWQNVDFKTIIGTMWEDYDYFTITLVSVIAGAVSALPTNIFDRVGIINLQGFQFINSNYSIATKTNIPQVQVGTIQISATNTGSITQNMSVASVMVQKGARNKDLTITLIRVADGTLLQGTGITGTDGAGIFPHQVYQFRIDGVDKK